MASLITGYSNSMGHIHEKIDFTTSIYIVHDGKVLLHVHKKLGIWLPPGGHIELDEDPNEAALREAKEETGLDIELIGEGKKYEAPSKSRDLISPRFLNRHFFDDTRTHEHVDLCYLARARSGEARHEVEGGKIKWFSKEDLESGEYEIFPDIKHHALTALKEVS